MTPTAPLDRSAIPRFDAERARDDFPILARRVRGKPLVYLDNAASTQKPEAVLEAMADLYREHYANVHRGVHTLSQEATAAYEQARERVAAFLGGVDHREVVFVRGATEAINLVAWSWAAPRLGEGDEILLTELEHHSNIVPWQLVAERTGARLRVVPMDERADVSIEAVERHLGPRTRMLAITHVSNAVGTVLPIAEIAARARERGVTVLVDGAQAAPHLPLDVERLGCDFYAFSGHKVYGPTGIGVLWGRGDRLEAMQPYQGGGEMIRRVRFEKTTFAPPPARFEAGTPHIAGAVGLAAGLDYLQGLGLPSVAAHEQDVVLYAEERLAATEGVRLIGRPRRRAAVVSFLVDGVHAHDVGTILDGEGIAVRAGHHCAQPLMERFGVPATARASFALYHTRAEVDALVEGIGRVRALFR